MIINNFTEMSNFLNGNGLGAMAGRLTACVNEYAAICICKPSDRGLKQVECENCYSVAVSIAMANKHAIFNSIRDNVVEFKRNGQVIAVISR